MFFVYKKWSIAHKPHLLSLTASAMPYWIEQRRTVPHAKSDILMNFDNYVDGEHISKILDTVEMQRTYQNLHISSVFRQKVEVFIGWS